MTTVADPRPPAKPATGPVALVIKGTRYGVEPIPAGEFGTIAFRLSKHGADAAVYDVVRTHDGLAACDCPHYEARLRGLSSAPCKHGTALIDAGLAAPPDGRRDLGAPAGPSRPVDERDRRQAAAFGIRLPAPAPAPAPAACCPADEPTPCQACVPGVPRKVAIVPPSETGPADGPAWQGAEPRGVRDADIPADDLAAPPAPAPASLLTLDAWIDAQAEFYLMLDSGAADLVARALRELAHTCRFVSALTPAEFEARCEVLSAV